ncbi:MAG: NUDIX hydrolase [Bacteroidetes bacterium HGW-Bacteroidetes-17]|jgi:8-oxo-dGTP diphosphatase|nr:MAG: NUDIX hydrolase [Bacteroidetes bacterium HGW-Bacteroidetes-17]
MSYTYDYPRPAVTVDCLIFRKKPELQILLIQRKYDPFKDIWALPGGFVEMDEDLIEAAYRELAEETGLKNIELFQLQTFGKPGRDPRGRTISIIFWGTHHEQEEVEAGDDAKNAAWFKISQLPELAFDHGHILNVAFQKIPNLNT